MSSSTTRCLPAVVDVLAAIKPDAPQLFDDAPGNIAVEAEFGDGAAVEAAFAKAHLVVEQTFRNQRVVATQMEPRAMIGRYDKARDMLTFVTGSQGAVRVKTDLAACLGMPPDNVHVITQDVGGAFGLRTHLNPEQIADRLGGAASQPHGEMDQRSHRSVSRRLSGPRHGHARRGSRSMSAAGCSVLSIDMTGNVGGHPVSYVSLNNAYRVQPTVYDLPLAHITLRGVLTNTVPTAPYRGAGRPEAILVLERLIDIGGGAARHRSRSNCAAAT